MTIDDDSVTRCGQMTYKTVIFLIGAVLGIGLILLAALGPIEKHKTEKPQEDKPFLLSLPAERAQFSDSASQPPNASRTTPSTPAPLTNAFLPWSQNPAPTLTPENLQTLTAPFTAPFSELGKQRSTVAASPASETMPVFGATASADILPLPSVNDEELTIRNEGFRTTQEYLSYFAAHSRNIPFSFEKMGNVLKDEYGVSLLPFALVERALADGNYSAVRPSLDVYRELTEKEISFLRSIPVTEDAAELNRKMIAFEKLYLMLDEKFARLSAGEIPRSEFDSWYERYQRTAAYHHGVLAKGLDIARREKGLLYRIARFVGLGELAVAITPSPIPFGGLITLVTPCDCPPTGLQAKVGPPVPGVYYFTTPFMKSPLFFPFKAVHPKAYTLGLFVVVSAPLTCLKLPTCVEVLPTVVIMAGTSI